MAVDMLARQNPHERDAHINTIDGEGISKFIFYWVCYALTRCVSGAASRW